MNEEDIKQFKKELWFNKGFQKGKLEQKKEELEFYENEIFKSVSSSEIIRMLINRRDEFEKVISEEKQNDTRRTTC